MRARKRLQLAAPICDDASLVQVNKEVADVLREAKRQDTPDELASTVIDEIVRKCFRHFLRTQASVMPRRRRNRA
jgi:hypothetical protein